MKKLMLLLGLILLVASRSRAVWGTPTNGGTFVATEHSCASATTCAITVPSTGAGHLLVGMASMKNQSLTIVGMAGGSTGAFNSGPTAWYHPAGGGSIATNICSVTDASAGSKDCAFVLSSTAGSTTITFTFSGTSGRATVDVFEVSYTNAPIGMDVSPVALDKTPGGTTIPGVALSLIGTNDFIVQGINPNKPFTSIDTRYTTFGTGAAYLVNSTVGTAPTWTCNATGCNASVNGIAFTEAAGVVPNMDNKWIAATRPGGTVGGLECSEPYNIRAGSGALLIITQLQTKSCSSIDFAPAAYSYTSGRVSTRNFNFLYGTVEFRVKFGGGAASGAWPIVFMFDAGSQPSSPTGGDNNGKGQEIDIAEILSSDFGHVNQQIHVPGPHNDGCSAVATDVSANFHVYTLIWSVGSLIWQIDGTTTCTITKAYVPNIPMYLIYATMVGAYGGTVKNRTLPWTSTMTYIKITQNGKVIFQDNFAPSAPT
jgi:hypothetical protein